MTLLNPAALIFAVLAPVIVLLYLLKLRRQPARVSTLMFWQRVTADHRRRALFQRLRQVLSLLLHLLIFALLLFALARPELAAFRGSTLAGSSTVLILDCRAQMQARAAGSSGPGGEPLFAAARRIVESYLRRAVPQSPVALLAAGSAPQVLAGFSGDEKALLAGLDQARATDAGGRLEDALQLARQLLAARAGERRIIVVTDRRPAAGDPEHAPPPAASANRTARESAAAARDPAASREPAVEWRLADPSAAPRENVGITRLTARPLPNSPQTDEVLLEIENFGPTRQTGSVELALDGRPLDVKAYDLPPGERRTEIYPALAARMGLANARGWLTAHLVPAAPGSENDAFPLDDDAFAVLPPLRPLRVLLVTRGNWFLESLFKADDEIEFNQLAPDAFQPARAAGFDAVVLDNLLPPGLGDLASLPPGNFLFVRQAPLPDAPAVPSVSAIPDPAPTPAPVRGPTASPVPAVPGSLPSPSPAPKQTAAPQPDSLGIDRPIVTDTDKESPLLRLADLRDISFVRARAWTLPPTGAPGGGGWRFTQPVRSLEHPLVVTGERTLPSTDPAHRRTQRFAALAFGATDSVELPLRVAFPLFIRNTVAWLGGRDEPSPGDLPESAGVRAGETLRLAAGETLWTVPQREFQPLPVPILPGELLAGPAIFQPSRDGFYLRRGADGTDHWLAVNTFNREVSALNGAATATQPASSLTPDASSAAPSPIMVRWFDAWLEALRVWPPWIYLALAALTICTLEWWGFHRRRTE